jgi:hypothetical protein
MAGIRWRVSRKRLILFTDWVSRPLKKPEPPLSLQEKQEWERAKFRDYCKRTGVMGLYYSCYPLETPPGFWDNPKDKLRRHDPNAAKAKLHQCLTAAGFEDVGKTLYPETSQVERGAIPETGHRRGGR